MRRNKYRRLRRILRVRPRESMTRRSRPPTRSVANVSPDIQRYSYQISLRRLALKMRAMSKRLRSMETQLARGYKTLSGTKAEMLSAPSVGGGLLWWATDERVLYVHDDTSWQLSKATQSGTTAERLAYTPLFTGEIWWDTTLEQLFVWNGSAWDDVAVLHSGTTVERLAYSQDTGDLWLDTTEREWYADIGEGWQVMNPSLADSFNRLSDPIAMLVPNALWWGANVADNPIAGYINATPYNSYGETINMRGFSGQQIILCMWVNPRYASGSAPYYGIIVHQRQHWTPDNTLGFALEQPGDYFSFGISTDGTRTNWYHADTPVMNNMNNSWHFLAGIYDPGNSIRLFHNGTWYEYGGATPVSRYSDQDFCYIWGTYSFWSIYAQSFTVPSDEIIEYIYDRTKGLFS